MYFGVKLTKKSPTIITNEILLKKTMRDHNGKNVTNTYRIPKKHKS